MRWLWWFLLVPQGFLLVGYLRDLGLPALDMTVFAALYLAWFAQAPALPLMLVGVAIGRALVDELIDWCTRPEYVYRHEWQQHDLVMWDNRCVLHRATVIPDKARRIMHRTTIAGVDPVR